MELKPQTAPINQVQRLFAVSYADSKLPVFKENKGKGIMNYGQTNDYPDKLIELSNRSPKHSAILKRKVKFIVGKETIVNGQKIAAWNKYDSIEQFKTKVVYDKKVIGAFAIEILFDRTGKASFYHIDVTKIRTLDHTEYQYWGDGAKTKQADIKYYAPYDPLKKELDPETGFYKPQIFYYREYRPQMGVYALPDYVGAIQYIEVDTRIANFHLNNITNGFTGGTLLQLFKDEPTHEEARATKRAFKQNFQGDDADETGGLIIQFNSANERAAEISPLTPNNLDAMYLQLNETVQEEIFVGHGVTSPMLFGVKTEGQLGGRNELVEAYEIYYKDVIEPEQQELDAILTMLWHDAGNQGEIETIKSEPIGQDYVALFQAGLVDKQVAQEALGLPMDVLPQKTDAQRLSDAINSLSPLVANKVINELSTNEVRALAGLPPIEGGNDKSEPTEAAFSEDNPFGWSDDLTIYSQYGEDANLYEPIPDEYASAKDKKILAVIKGNPKVTVEEIAKAVEIRTLEAEKILEKLEKDGQIKWTDNKISITDKGSGGIGEIVLRYKYAVSPEAKPLKTESRKFCQKLMDLNRVYTREDIDTMSAKLGYDVWTRRGGWYRVPDSNPPLNLPHCRHEWKNVILKKKVKFWDENQPRDENGRWGGDGDREQGNIKIKGFDKQTEVEINKVVNKTIKELNINGEITIQSLSHEWAMGGVNFADSPDEYGKYFFKPEIMISGKANNDLEKTIKHEMKHIQQAQSGKMFYKNGNLYWNGEKHISAATYNKYIKGMSQKNNKALFEQSIKKYNDLPWEMEANQYAGI